MPEDLLNGGSTANTEANTEQTTDTTATTTNAEDTTTNAEAGAEAKDKDSQADKSKDEGAPEAYESFTFPEGIEADGEVLEDFKQAARELNLSQKNAQKLIDLQTKLATKSATQMQEQFSKVVDEWRSQATADKEYGGKEFEANLGVAKKALDKFGTDEFKKAINDTSFGNHPELIRFIYRVGKAMSEDGVLNGGTGNSGSRDPAKILFPDMN
jgi:hypothetical protein